MFELTMKEKLKKLYPGIVSDDKVIFIGMDPRETTAYQVLKASIKRTSPGIKVFPLYARDLRQVGLYERPMMVVGKTGQYFDITESRPHSVEFSFTRFLVPEIARQLGIKGWVMFMDCDMVVTEDLNVMFDNLKIKADGQPLAVVHHNFKPDGTTKMDGVSQLKYNKKLWSAVMVFNMKHPYLDILTAERVNKSTGMYLHQFDWLGGSVEDVIYNLPETYQFIPGHSDSRVAKPAVIHYTEKAPWFKDEFIEDSKWSEIWWDAAQHYKSSLLFSLKYDRFWE